MNLVLGANVESGANLELATNKVIRAIVNVSIKHRVNMTKLRRELGIPSINTQSNRARAFEAWKWRKRFANESLLLTGPTTRIRKHGDVPLSAVSTRENALRKAYNDLNPTLKRCNDPTLVKKIIKRVHT